MKAPERDVGGELSRAAYTAKKMIAAGHDIIWTVTTTSGLVAFFDYDWTLWINRLDFPVYDKLSALLMDARSERVHETDVIRKTCKQCANYESCPAFAVAKFFFETVERLQEQQKIEQALAIQAQRMSGACPHCGRGGGGNRGGQGGPPSGGRGFKPEL
jgi:hypothetical protein